VRRDRRPLVAQHGVEVEDGLLLLLRELAPLDVRPQVVGPSQPAALAAPVQPCSKLSAKSIIGNVQGIIVQMLHLDLVAVCMCLSWLQTLCSNCSTEAVWEKGNATRPMQVWDTHGMKKHQRWPDL
jgi:hypothetical protein